jgi:hypothetical protein
MVVLSLSFQEPNFLITELLQCSLVIFIVAVEVIVSALQLLFILLKPSDEILKIDFVSLEVSAFLFTFAHSFEALFSIVVNLYH